MMGESTNSAGGVDARMVQDAECLCPFDIGGGLPKWEWMAYHINAALAQPAGDARDAARYRLMTSAQNLSNPAIINAVVLDLVEKGGSWTSKETWDAAIDAALAQEQPNG